MKNWIFVPLKWTTRAFLFVFSIVGGFVLGLGYLTAQNQSEYDERALRFIEAVDRATVDDPFCRAVFMAHASVTRHAHGFPFPFGLQFYQELRERFDPEDLLGIGMKTRMVTTRVGNTEGVNLDSVVFLATHDGRDYHWLAVLKMVEASFGLSRAEAGRRYDACIAELRELAESTEG